MFAGVAANEWGSRRANGTVGQPGIGANAAQFLARIRELLETPLALLA